MISLLKRMVRHIRLSLRTITSPEDKTPPFLILFINSTCNLTCEHCFYWRSLNKEDDLTRDEIINLAKELGPLENLNLSGGEPFIRQELGEICRFFISNNKVKQIYIPTSGYFTKKTEKQLKEILKEPSLQLVAIELSLDGMPEYHNKFRGNNKSFENAMETYDMLAELQKIDPRVRIHSISTATSENIHEIMKLTHYLYERCPAMDHHNLAIIRGDRKNPSLKGPQLEAYRNLYQTIALVWREREKKRFGAIVEPLLQWAKYETIRQQTQVIPCMAGRLSAVVYANGDVSVCEIHPPLGNLREKSFFEIWNSPAARRLREDIRAKKCYCTTEMFLWPSITFQPLQLVKALYGARRWEKPRLG
ncbi:MAG TPA: radical SAM protein [Candidatus Limnocylindrales bacterium]|nr:radical SAM protein [Candidatus Limnocylindrales bacterium]